MIPGSTRKLEPGIKAMLFKSYTINGIAYHVTNYEIQDLKVVIVTDIKVFNILHINLGKMLDMFIEVSDSHLILEHAEHVKIPEPEKFTEQVFADLPVLSITPVEPVQEQSPGHTKIEVLSASREIKDILMDNIRKVQRDRNYIHQAASINESVKTLIEFAKTEIQAQELVLKITSGITPSKAKLLI